MNIELPKIIELDLDHESLHAAANAATVFKIGGKCYARVKPTGDVSDPMEYVTVIREYAIEGHITERDLAIVAIAGEIAVTVRYHMLETGGEFPTTGDLYDDLEPNDFTLSSRERLGGYLPEGLDDPALFDLLEEALRILVANWNLIEVVAEVVRNLFREQYDPTLPDEDESFVENGLAYDEPVWVDVTTLISELEESPKNSPYQNSPAGKPWLKKSSKFRQNGNRSQ